MLSSSTDTSSSLAGTCRSGDKPQNLGWPKAYLDCWIYWFHWNPGVEIYIFLLNCLWEIKDINIILKPV